MTRFPSRRGFALALLACLGLLFATDALRASPPGNGNGNGGGGGGPHRGTIVGEVDGVSGPIGGATVMLFDGVAIDQVAETFSDANGNFTFSHVPAGDYTVTAISLDPPCAGSTPVTVVPRQTSIVIVACQ